MKDLLDNDICIGDKVVFPAALIDRKELDYGIVEKLSDNGKSCWCKSFRYNIQGINRKHHQIIKIG